MATFNDTLITAIQEIVDNAVDNAGYDKTRTCIILSEPNANNTYTVNMDGIVYDNIPCNGGGTFEVGEVTKIYIPNNQMPQAYIEKVKVETPEPPPVPPTPEEFEFPIGYIFEWSGQGITGAPDLTTASKVATYFGYGTWELYGVGKVMACIDTNDTAFATDGLTGGSKDSIIVEHGHTQQNHEHGLNNHTHTLGNHTHTGGSHSHVNSNTHRHEIGSHTHTFSGNYSGTTGSGGAHSHTPSSNTKGFVVHNKDVNIGEHTVGSSGTTNNNYIYTTDNSDDWINDNTTSSEPAHTHSFSGSISGTTAVPPLGYTGYASAGSTDSGGQVATSVPSTNTSGTATGNTAAVAPTINNTGVSGTNKNLQPYITVYRYRRIA